ncbi:hypothetical protein [Sulfitobacter sp. 1A15106]|uniref:hypothetical protein n=1 Tax=Sulfitobacter sp. 1A15106 TaxID=3368590 RepID=UPI0037471A16
MAVRVSVSSDIDSLKRALAEFTEQTQKTLIRRTVNEGAQRKALPLAVKAAKERGRWDKAGYARSKTNLWKASNSTLEAKVIAKQRRRSLISNFMMVPRAVKAGQVVKRARPWGEARAFKHKVFMVPSKQDGKLIPVRRVGKKQLKGVYGAGVPREIERDIEDPNSRYDILDETSRYMQTRLAHHLTQAANAAKSRYRV